MSPTSPRSPPETPESLQVEHLEGESELPETRQETVAPDTFVDDPKYIGDQLLSVTSRNEQSLSGSGSSSPRTTNDMIENPSREDEGQSEVQIPSTQGPLTPRGLHQERSSKFENSPTQRKFLSSRGNSNHVAKHDFNQGLRSPRPAYQAQQAAKSEQNQAQRQPDSAQLGGQADILSSSEDETDEDNEILGPLEAFDYKKIAQDYQREMEALTEKERTYWDEMADYNKLAAAWALGASNRDNFRASKRFKTREKYVQLSEETLAVKNANYAEARAAFENAVKMFKKF